MMCANRSTPSEEVFDYIICGAGTSGCVVAGRLAEAGVGSILLLEAGCRNEDVPASAIPGALSKVLGTDADWNIWSEPGVHLNNRSLHLGRGKFVGGSSGCNGCVCIRGTRQDYDDWNVEGWSGDEMFEYMSKAESFSGESWFEADPAAHGTKGPLKTGMHDPAPISLRCLESFQSKGLPLIPDVFSTGESASGCGHAVRTISKGVRSTAYDFIKGRPNITLKTMAYVDRVVVENGPDNKLSARGVEILDADDSRLVYRARKEVILSSGAFGSPPILMRSGIGRKSDLEEHAIEPRLELPGVGYNLMDHMVLLNSYEVSDADITKDNEIWHTGGLDKSMAQYQKDHTGFMSKFPFGCFAWTRLDKRLEDSDQWQEAIRRSPKGRDPLGLTKDQPHVEYWNTECYVPKYLYEDFPGDGKHAFALVMTLFAAKSRGTVKLKSNNPKDLPRVDHNHLSDPLDMLVFSEACRFANEIVLDGAGTKSVVRGSWPETLTHHKYTERSDWEKHIRERAETCYHPAGTCRMGRAGDPGAVVDGKLRVFGVHGLRIADASIMPLLNGGHPQMVCYAIGEKLADMLIA